MGRQDELAVVAAARRSQAAGLCAARARRALRALPRGRATSRSSERRSRSARRCVDRRRRGSRWQRFSTDAFSALNPLLTFRCLPNMPAFHVSLNFDIQGPYFVSYPGIGQFYLALEEAVRRARERADRRRAGRRRRRPGELPGRASLQPHRSAGRSPTRCATRPRSSCSSAARTRDRRGAASRARLPRLPSRRISRPIPSRRSAPLRGAPDVRRRVETTPASSARRPRASRSSTARPGRSRTTLAAATASRRPAHWEVGVSHRVVVTGMGVVSPIGQRVGEFPTACSPAAPARRRSRSSIPPRCRRASRPR